VRYLLSAIILLSSLGGFAQVGLLDSFVKAEFQSRVKSVDEFIDRFNGVSEFEGATRRDLLMSLFDASNPLNLKGDKEFFDNVDKFVTQVDASGLKLSLPSDGVTALVKVTVSGKGMSAKPALLRLKADSHPKRKGEWGWAVSGVEGLTGDDLGAMRGVALLNPFGPDHHFQTLGSDLSGNAGSATLYRSSKSPADTLTLLLEGLSSGSLRIDSVNDVCLEIASVPGFTFTVREFDRRGSNSGWLISEIKN